MIVLVASRVRLAGSVADLLGTAGGRSLEDLVVDHMTLDHAATEAHR